MLIDDFFMRTRNEDHTSFFFTNNIVLFDSGELLGGNWGGNHYLMDHNVYWDTRLAAAPDEMRFACATFKTWQSRGHDLNSVVADPQFVAPTEWNFHLKRGSPALKLGFKPIDLRTAGVRRSGYRTLSY